MYCGFDTETTGLPRSNTTTDTAKNRWKPLPDYRDLAAYDNARLVQVCFMLINRHGIQETYTRYINTGVYIPNTEFHGITNAIVAEHGITIEQFFRDLEVILNKSSVLFAYNIQFDLNIIKSELFRFSVNNATYAERLIALLDAKMCTCIMAYASERMHINRSPSMKQFYYFAFGKDFEKAHTADADVRAMHDAMVKCGFPFDWTL
jgi:DNA polymerase-3 subunit alpha